MKVSLRKLNIFVIYIVIISYTKVLGIYKDVAGIGLGNLNVLGLFQIVSVTFLILLLIVDLLINFPKLKFTTSAIMKFILFYFVIIVFSILKGIINVSMAEISLGDYLFNIKTIYIYVFFVFLLFVFHSKNDLHIIFKIINRLAIVAVIITIYKVLFAQDAIRYGDRIYDQFRYMSTTGYLIAFSFFIHLARLLQNKSFNLLNIILLLLTFIGVSIQMSRSILANLVITILFAFLINFKIQNVQKIVSISLFLVATVTLVLLKITTLPLTYFNTMILGTINDLNAGEGSFFVRLYTFINTVIDVYSNYPLFGRGFVWEKLDILSYWKNFIALRPTYDNTYSSVLICFGFVGFTTYLLLIITSITHLIKKARMQDDPYSLPLLLILIYYAISSFFSDYLFGFASTIITLIMFFTISLNISKNKTIKK